MALGATLPIRYFTSVVYRRVQAAEIVLGVLVDLVG
jgi:hypothetical protein